MRALHRGDVRRTAAQSLRSLGHAALPYVKQAAVDDDPGVRAGAYSALRSLGAAGLPLLRRGSTTRTTLRAPLPCALWRDRRARS